MDDKITNEDLDMMIEEIDSDGSGTVDFDGIYFRKYLKMCYNVILSCPYRIHGSHDRWRRLNFYINIEIAMNCEMY